MWFKVDDQLATHPKVVRAGNAAMGLWVRAGSWSARWLTDGYVPADVLATFGATGRQAELLDRAGLWVKDMDGWRFHDWHEFQPTAEDVRLYQQATADAAVRGNHYRWHVRRGVSNPECPLCLDPGSGR